MHLAAPESRPQFVKLNQHWQRIDKQMTTSLYIMSSKYYMHRNRFVFAL